MQDYSKKANEEERDVCIYFEKVDSVNGVSTGSRNNTGSAIFNFGVNYGFQLGVCQALGFRVQLVPTATWEKYYPCKTRRVENEAQHKRELREHAAKLFPDLRPTLAATESLLILDYATRQSYLPFPPK